MISVRPAVITDLTHLPEVERSAGDLFRSIGMAAVADAAVPPAETWAPAYAAGLLWVAADSDAPVGFIACEVVGGLLFVHELAVASSHQRTGLGRALMQAAIDASRERRLAPMGLRTFRDVPWNGPFYRTLGFEETEAPELSGVIEAFKAAEARAGLDPSRRCTMVRRVAQPEGRAPPPPRSAMTATPAPDDRSEATRLVHAGDSPEARLGAAARIVAPAVQRASTVLLPDAASLYSDDQPTYGRMGLGVQAALESALCELEGAQTAQLFSSGAAAVTGALMSVLSAGDELLLTNGAYRPTQRLCHGFLKRFGVSTRTFAPDASVEEVMAMAGAGTRAIFLESPASLTFELQDVPAIATAARERGLLTLIDNTWGAGVLFKPLAAGVDVSIQALTKYVSGGSDVFMGSVAVADPALAERLRHTVRDTGWAVSPDDCYTVLRSLRTLPLRLRRHGESALEIVRWLEARAEVTQLLCPALPSSPDHALWTRDFGGMNGLFGLVLRPAPQAAVDAFLNALELFGLGFSWGGFESLAIVCDPQIERAARPFHPAGPVIRLHIGLEAPQDLIADLDRGLAAFSRACKVQA